MKATEKNGAFGPDSSSYAITFFFFFFINFLFLLLKVLKTISDSNSGTACEILVMH